MLVVDGDVELAGVRAVEGLIESGVCGSGDYCKTTPSTNTKALQDVRSRVIQESLLPRCYLTDEQTAGRGRHGRSWQSDGGTLTFSLVVERPVQEVQRSQLLPLAVGLGIARFIDFEFAPLNAKLKWPNDVHIGGGKVAGVLLETRADAPGLTVIGVGLNVSSEPGLEGNAIGITSKSLAQVVGRQLRRYEVLEPLVESILGAVAEARDSPKSVIEDFRVRCLLTGQPISFQHMNRKCVGQGAGISEEGELLVKTAEGTHAVSSGEARLVRVSTN